MWIAYINNGNVNTNNHHNNSRYEQVEKKCKDID